jgi:transposase
MTLNPSSHTVLEFAALVGIDWADQKHDVCLLDLTTQEPQHFVLSHTAEAIDDWAAELRQRFGGRPVGICLEQSRGALVYALMKYEHLVLFPLNPRRLKNFRSAVTNSGAKDDPTDAQFLLEYLRHHRQHLIPWKPDDALTRQIGLLVEQRRQAVELRTRLANRMRSSLKQYFPQALQWTGDALHSRLSCDFLLKWSTLSAVQKASPQTLRKFFYGHHYRNEAGLKERLAQIRQARPLTTDAAFQAGYALTVTLLARQLRELKHSLAEFDRELARLMAQHPDAAIFTSFPGAGQALAPRLVAAFGSDRRRLDSSAAMQNLSGIAPVTKRSGRSTVVQRRYACPKFLRQTFHEFAVHSLQKSLWAKAYYQHHRARGQGHHAAVRALAFKWIRILFRCWQDRAPYNESRYLEALQQRGAPLLKYLASAAATARE